MLAELAARNVLGYFDGHTIDESQATSGHLTALLRCSNWVRFAKCSSHYAI